MKRLVLASLLVAGGLLVVAPATAQTAHHSSDTSAAVTLHQDMRKLWTDHVVWTRQYIVSAIADQPDAQAAANRLMKNQDDIGAAVATYYGKPAGDKLTGLLKEHILIAVDLIKAAKAHNTATFQEGDRKWDRNAEEIADFLSKANPNWPKATLTDMMKMHLTTTKAEVTARLNRNWEEDVKAFDAVYSHILMMSDALSD